MANIMFVGVFSSQSTNVSQVSAFRRLGHDVIEYDYRAVGAKFGNNTRDLDLIEQCRLYKPDIVLFSKCTHHDKSHVAHINSATFEKCKEFSKVVLWYMDPMDNYDSGLITKIALADHSFFALEEPYQRAQHISSKVSFLQEGYDEDSNLWLSNVGYEHDVSFIGNVRDSQRRSYLAQVPFRVIDNAYGIDHSIAVAKSIINLNFVLHNAGTSDRTYKILASKGFLLTQPWANMERDFTPGKDFEVFDSPKELSSKVDYYLCNERERNIIRAHGYDTVQKFNRQNWAKVIVETTMLGA